MTPEWWNRVLLAQDPTEGLREVARRSLAVDEHGNKASNQTPALPAINPALLGGTLRGITGTLYQEKPGLERQLGREFVLDVHVE
jgi:hypothetical protein